MPSRPACPSFRFSPSPYPSDMADCRVEVVASSVEDVHAAAAGGADRVEFCVHLDSGGLTPGRALTADALEVARSEGLGFRVLVRPREGSFVYSLHEKRAILHEAEALMSMGVDKVVTGALTEEGAIDVDLIGGLEGTVGLECVVFHRAFDELGGAPLHRRQLLDSGVCSLLTSGGAARAVEGVEVIQAAVAEGLTVIAGAGVRPGHVQALVDAGVEAVHASCRVQVVPATAGRLFDMGYQKVDPVKVRALVEAVRHA